MVDAQRMARAEPGEALLRARVPLDRQAQRRALGRQLEHEVLGAGELEAQLGAAAAVERSAIVVLRSSVAAMVAATARSGKPRRSSAITPSVTCTKRSRTSPSHAHTVSARRSRRPARRTWMLNGARAISTRSAPELEHAVAGRRGAHGCVFHGRRRDAVIRW